MRGTKLSLFVALVTLTGYLVPIAAQAEDTLAAIRKAGKVTVALASIPPYMIVSPSGEATGASVDLQNMVLKNMGLPALTPVLTDWSAMIPGLQVKQFDYIGAGWNITEAFCKVVLFSAPTYVNPPGLFVSAGNPKKLTSVADIARQPDSKLAVAAGKNTPYEQYALKQGVKPEQIIYVPDIQAGVATVTGGRADAYITGQLGIPHPEQKGLELVHDKGAPLVAGGMVFRKEDVALRDAYNKELNVLVRNGTLLKLYEKYQVSNGDAIVQGISKFTKAADVEPSCE
ncbi:ectoine/hydroxyectoine ABC transporter substrate-binding protein EhuB [Bradyrhizobium vignae]|uniref:Putative Extracellular solute-binding protein n=1 Tax=Bradyrhizobium vignae TaxID=1549949 RepID=A0A2U3Q9R1_9BRAD|nr:ectoine/hydroxyectoine ABC transporter substrate-binding protein EhuB [Bradyrhizobium vignae]SPP98090.1 putative Extracellular solute-binding protein [Bradyrhizobium vignae]